jgi:hypothetical protein
VKECDLCSIPCATRIWMVVPNVCVCWSCSRLPWREFHDKLLDRFGSGVPKLYPEIKS